jgi:hypothetical protein
LSRDASTLASGYANRLVRLEHTRRRSEELFRARKIVARDIYHIYEALFLASVTSFEGFLEDLFIGLLVGRIKGSRAVAARIVCRSDAVAREILLQGDDYLDWLPYHHTRERAEAFFRAGFPFARLTTAQELVLKQISYTRNAVAHQSRHALEMFERKVLSSVPLLPNEKNPSGFLRSIVASAPTQSRYEQLAGELSSIAQQLCL